ncbi:MAG: homoserine dehydrogenase [Spirochaetales bacterium]|nr:homoserine dehydrogenase [Spirochaetales bacterium]
MNKKKIGIALLGCGTVGSSVAKMLTQQKDILLCRHKVELDLTYIVDIDFTFAEKLNIDKSLFCTDFEKVLEDTSINIVIELIGGLTIAKQFIEKALKAGKNVVTANKALLAHHGSELLTIAREHGVCIAFEASCAGGIPILRALMDGLIANRIDAMYGIVNGTSNYILTAMTMDSLPYATALKEAQDDGLAEADPTLDVEGIDSGHKLTILASFAFGKNIDFEKIPIEGIHTLDICDIEYGKELGYVIKLLAIARKQEKGINVYVRPAFISMEHPLSWVSGPFNAVSVYGHATGHTMYYGRGAGGDPTASAVISDLYQVATGITKTLFDSLQLWPDQTEKAHQLSREDFTSRYYIRLTVEDKPGVLAQIADKFGKNGISISSVLQQEIHPESDIREGVPVIITTHPAREGSVIAALKAVDDLDESKTESICIAILDEND